MQRFLISIFLATFFLWLILLIFASKTGDTGVLQDLFFVILLFTASSFTISLIFYFGRLIISNSLSRGKIRLEETTDVNLRPVWRRSFKMATVVSAFIGVLAFLQLEELLNLLNLSLLIAIIILGSIWLRR